MKFPPRLPALVFGAITALASLVFGIPVGAAAVTPFALKLAFARFDRNGDGKLDQSEQAAMAERRFEQIDANRDGAIARDEFVKARAGAAVARIDADFARMDANRDGSVSAAEFIADRAGQFAALADADRDGLISADEFMRIAAARPVDP